MSAPNDNLRADQFDDISDVDLDNDTLIGVVANFAEYYYTKRANLGRRGQQNFICWRQCCYYGR